MSDARHKIELLFEDGVLTAKLICPTNEEDKCSEHEGQCDARDWFDNVSVEEILSGKMTVPIQIDWPGPEEGPEMKIIEPETEQRVRDERQIVNCFLTDLPETVRMMDANSLVCEIEFGKDATPQDDELPPQEVYDRYQLALDRLEAAGILQSKYDPNWGVRAYALTEEGYGRVQDQVVNYLEKRSAAESVRAGRGDIPVSLAAERKGKIEDVVAVVKLPMEPGK